jgi:putative transposase
MCESCSHTLYTGFLTECGILTLMPSRNEIREFAAGHYYHVYNRGVEKRLIFMDDQDYIVFLGLLKKYLSGEKPDIVLQNRHLAKPLTDEVQLLAYCLMPNHFHLLFHQLTDSGITKLMQRVVTGYVMYFNHRHHRVGALFQRRYKASLINSDAYLHHISRYIHMNPADFEKWPYSSLPNYMGKKQASWLNPKSVMDLFDNSPESYLKFVREYAESKQELTELKWQLANDPDDV